MDKNKSSKSFRGRGGGGGGSRGTWRGRGRGRGGFSKGGGKAGGASVLVTEAEGSRDADKLENGKVCPTEQRVCLSPEWCC